MADNSLGMIISALIAVVIFGAVIGIMTDSTIGKQGTGNVTGATSTMVGLIPIFVVIGVLVAILSGAGLKVAGKI